MDHHRTFWSVVILFLLCLFGYNLVADFTWGPARSGVVHESFDGIVAKLNKVNDEEKANSGDKEIVKDKEPSVEVTENAGAEVAPGKSMSSKLTAP